MEGCDRELVAKGLCDPHYRRLKDGRPLDAPIRPGPSRCSMDGCERLVGKDNLCSAHDYRKRNGLDMDAPFRTYLQTVDLAERMRCGAPPGDPEECWEWTRGKSKGYGMVSIGGTKNRGAHIVAWELANDMELPDGLLIRHLCNTPGCVNPGHLRVGTDADNMADKVAHNRQSRGESHYAAKVNEGQVREIRARAAAGEPRKDIAAAYNISRASVDLIVTRKRWAHVE